MAEIGLYIFVEKGRRKGREGRREGVTDELYIYIYTSQIC
jgi:hypothetical protein